ncbi:MAG: M14 family metallopeptidase [Balneolaceae bacterium]|nr:M14 family metallopeptidase [Balneolaceae bacterium]
MKRMIRITALIPAILLLTVQVLPAQETLEEIAARQALRSPSDFLGYELGTRWTPHHRVIDYFRYVADRTTMVDFEQYGTSNEGRELVIVKISSLENMKRLENIRKNNLKRAGMLPGEPDGEEKTAIVWLSYNVHGNETSSSEAAMKTLYELASPAVEKTKAWLENTVVIMDPMINPDGRDRYVHWYTETAGDRFNPHLDAREHHEPWPGGRTNHFYFDLNRDWSWLTQKESRHRINIYQQWLPHIHVDYHEQSIDDPYYFAPAAKPFHQAITEWQEEFQYVIGKNHAHYFDKNNWLYFTRQVFDLFYPGYGDTYPIFNGAIGMTYEQAGGRAAGLGVLKAEGDTLTLGDRIMHHHTTGLSTVEITSKHADRVVDEFAKYYHDALNNPGGSYKSFVIKNDSVSGNYLAMLELLNQHQVEYQIATEEGRYEAYNYRTGENERIQVRENDTIVSLYQPKSVLARIFFEPEPELTDSLTYDITAWALPYAFGVETYAVKQRISGQPFKFMGYKMDNSYRGAPYAYLATWDDFRDARFLADLLENDIVVRYSLKPFSVEGRRFDRGTLVITRTGNTRMGSAFDRKVQELATENGVKVYPASTGFVDSGVDFGSDDMHYLPPPRVAVLSGEGTSSYRVGEIWHYFERQVDYPVTLINLDDINGVEWHEYDVLILPPGIYRGSLQDSQLNDIRKWISSGGKLIAVGGANRFLAGKDGFMLKRKTEEDDEFDGTSDAVDIYDEISRKNISQRNPGSIFSIELDHTHPLGFGYGDRYFSLKLGTSSYDFLENGWNVGVVGTDPLISGFVGHKAKSKLLETLAFGVQEIGNGSVVYMIDNPLYRGFWHNGKLLFSNAVFLVGN